MSKREPAHFSQNDQIYHFRAKIGCFWVIFGKTITLPEFWRTQISLFGSVLTVFDSKTHHNPKASMSQLIFLKMTKYTMSGPKLAVFGPIIAELLLLLPKFCRTQISLLGSVLTTFGSKSHHSP